MLSAMVAQRREALVSALASQGIDAFFGWSETTFEYLRGLKEHPGHRFIVLGYNDKGEEAMICGALSESQARRAGVVDVRSWKDGEDPKRLFHDLCQEWNLRSAVISVDEDMPALLLLQLQAVLPAALFKDGGPILAALRRTKKPEEIALMRKAAQIADKAYDEVKPKIKIGMTERQVEGMLFDAMISRGGTPNFGIVGAGAGGAEPHHATSDAVLQNGDVVVLDFGCDVEGYRSDITRMVGLGNVPEKAHRVHEIVYNAFTAGHQAAISGAVVGEVDATARKVIEDAGYGPQFMHRLGHGIGLMGHEQPYLIPKGEDVLKPGDCFSVEPGVYLEGEFGVRIENIFHATEHGNESLNAMPSPTLEIL
jgi:Xaa-Pro aminopeptidase